MSGQPSSSDTPVSWPALQGHLAVATAALDRVHQLAARSGLEVLAIDAGPLAAPPRAGLDPPRG
jgi:hypothetical protein